MASFSYITGMRDLLAVAGIVSPLMFFCLVVGVYYLALELFDLRTALVASFFTALSPHFIFIAFYPEGEITYTFFLTLSLLFFMRTVTRRSTPMAVATGISFALAWMARSEGFLVMMLVLACATILQGRGFHRSAVFRCCLITILFFMMTASPYLIFLKEHYGAWVISPKSTYVMISMKSMLYHDNDKGEIGNDELWGLTSDGEKLRWQEPKGITDLIGYLMSHPAKSMSVYLHNLGREVPGRIPNNSGMERYPQLYPVYLALAALFAVFVRWGNCAREKRAVLLAPLVILFILPVFTEGWWKYMIPYLPVIMVLAAKGFTTGAEMIAGKISSRHGAGLAVCLVVVIASVIGARFLFALHPFSLERSVPSAGPTPAPSAVPPVVVSPETSMRRNLAEEARKAGLWGVKQFGPGKNYMANWSRIVYYLDGSWTAFPVADYFSILTYARRNGVDYIVVEMIGEDNNAESGNPYGSDPYGLVLAGVYRSASNPYAVYFYRVMP